MEASNGIGGRVKKLAGFVDYTLDVGSSFVVEGYVYEMWNYTEMNETLLLRLVQSADKVLVFDVDYYAYINYTYWEFLRLRHGNIWHLIFKFIK